MHRNMKTTQVESISGDATRLLTDDTYTLSFEDGTESTPATLAARISAKSLRLIAQDSKDENERNKAARALAVTTPTYKISGADAIRLAERDRLTLHKYADPIEEARDDISAEEAEEVIREDPKLVYVHVQFAGWTGRIVDGHPIIKARNLNNVGDYFMVTGEYLGPDEDDIEPVWTDA